MSESDTPNPMPQEKQKWYDSAIPDAVKKADAAPIGSAAAINPETLIVPQQFLGREPLNDVLTDLRNDFIAYYREQPIGNTGDEMTVQEAFDQQITFFCNVTENIDNAMREDHPSKILFLWDVDETMGKVAESLDQTKLEDFKKKFASDPPIDESDPKAKYLLDTYSHWVWNPAFLITANWIQRHYGDKIVQGVLTTKEQKGLEKYLTPMLADTCPEVFRDEFIMSSRDGAAEKLIPELIDKPQEGERRGVRIKDISISDALDAIHASQALREIILERVIDRKDGPLTEYDAKLFMMAILEERLLKEDKEGMDTEPPEGVDPDEHYDILFGKPIVMIADDGVDPSILPHSLVRYVNVPRFRFPDDLDFI